MKAENRAKLVNLLQDWFDDEFVADDLGGTDGIWQCTDTRQRNANLCADAVELVIKSMALQSQLETEH